MLGEELDALSAQNPNWRHTKYFRKANITVKFVDIYGFPVEGNINDLNVLNEVKERVQKQRQIWWTLEESKGANWYVEGLKVSSLKLFVAVNTIILRKLIRKGVPPPLRPKVWLSISGAGKKRLSAPEGYYNDLITAVEEKVAPATLMQIDHDLPRTFPAHPWLDTLEGHAALRRILVAYSVRDARVGYCQGLNYVAALLLLMMKTEEEAFWMLAVLLEDILVRDCYTDNLSGCHVEQRVFKDLFRKKCPRIAARLKAIEFDVSLVATEWFLCLFSKSLPSETTMRVWDILFHEGVVVIFSVALAIFKLNEEELLRASQIDDVVTILNNSTRHLFDPDELLTVAFDEIGPLTSNAITKERKKQESAVMAELEKRLRRINSQKIINN